MYYFGKRSLARLAGVREDLRHVAFEVMKLQVYDFTIVCGHRDELTQNRAFRLGNSTKEWPNSQHNTFDEDLVPCSNAIDFAPWYRLATGKMGIPWLDAQSFAIIGGMFIAIGEVLGTPLRYGGDWDMDGNTTEHRLKDWGHIEVINR